eukprot:782782_1
MSIYESPSSKISLKSTKSSLHMYLSHQHQHIHPIISCENELNNHLKPSYSHTKYSPIFTNIKEQINIYCKYEGIKILLHLLHQLILIINIISIMFIFQKIVTCDFLTINFMSYVL